MVARPVLSREVVVRIKDPQQMELGSIFLGNTPSEQRKFLKEALAYLLHKGKVNLYVPCCGQFAIASAAIEAGWRPEHIFTSDISLFSSLIGYYYSGQDIEKLQYIIVDEELRSLFNDAGTQEEKIALMLLWIKRCQLRQQVYYERQFLNELTVNRGKFIAQLVAKLKAAKEVLGGINYEVRDLRDYFSEEFPYEENDVLVVNPPAFSKGYSKMFNHADAIDFQVDISEFMFATEYDTLFQKSKELKPVSLWYRYKEIENYTNGEAIFGKEYTTERTDFWLTPKPEDFEDFQVRYTLIRKLSGKKPIKKYQILQKDEEIKADDKATFVQCPTEVSSYYRELWAHKLGVTGCEFSYLIFIGDKLVGTVGFHASEVRRLTTNKVFEVYCFNVHHEKYKNLNRLMMMLLTCKEMNDVLMGTAFKTNRIFEIDGLKTTCLSKYRKVKLNNGLLTINKREKMKNGLYKIVYETEWHDRSFQDCIHEYLTESHENGKSY